MYIYYLVGRENYPDVYFSKHNIVFSDYILDLRKL